MDVSSSSEGTRISALREGGVALLSVLNRYQLTWWLETIRRLNRRWLRRRLASDVEFITLRRRGLRGKRKLWSPPQRRRFRLNIYRQLKLEHSPFYHQ